MNLPVILPEWRTATVIELCQSMREAQDFSALPILADALQDAGCPEGEPLLAELRTGYAVYARTIALVACCYGADAQEAVEWLINYGDGDGGAPSFDYLIPAAVGYSSVSDEYGSISFDVLDNYLQFDGTDAHGVINPEMWAKVALATGKNITAAGQPTRFSCLC